MRKIPTFVLVVLAAFFAIVAYAAFAALPASGQSLDIAASGGDRSQLVTVTGSHTERTDRAIFDFSARFKDTGGDPSVWHVGARNQFTPFAGAQAIKTVMEAYWHQDNITSAGGLGIGAGGLTVTGGVRTEATDGQPRDSLARLAATLRGEEGALSYSFHIEALKAGDEQRIEWRNKVGLAIGGLVVGKHRIATVSLSGHLDRTGSRKTDVWGVGLGFKR